MSTILWTVFFTDGGAPAAGLTTGGSGANITVRRLDTNAIVVNAQALTEVGSGWYKYLQTGTDDALSYVALFDGDTLDDNAERYQAACDLDGSVRKYSREVHQLMGLDPTKPLVVDSAIPSGTRDAGAEISQTIETAGTETTVTRI